ncbi:hypothetical protein PFISCL1PPCAC_11706, partial [Pristionchus fissidentatus]
SVDWNARGISRIGFGVYCLLFGLVSIPPYFACSRAIWTMREVPVYKVRFYAFFANIGKIMFFLSIVDIASLFFSSIYFGIMLIRVVCFVCSTVVCVLLSLNRLGELLFLRWISALFTSSGTSFLILSTICYGLFVALFTPPMLFNSTYHSFMNDPMIVSGRYI